MLLRIVTHESAAIGLASQLTVPHTLTVLPGGNDAHIARLLCATDVLVSPAYKSAWRNAASTSLRLVHSTGAGVDAIETQALPPGCIVCNVYGHDQGVTEQAVMLMLALQKNLLAFDAALRRGNWSPQFPYMREMRNANLLVLGFGHIGYEVARWGHFMNMKVVALTRDPSRVRANDSSFCNVASLSHLHTYLPNADFVVVALPATTETHCFIGEAELRLMQRSAFIVNVGRAAVIDEKALYRALSSRQIAGAGLDVWYQYPVDGQDAYPSQYPFHELTNVVMTPHKATIETMEYRLPAIAKNIDRFARGEPVLNQVWP